MNLLFHHVCKDLRHSRWLIVLTWLTAACILWLPASLVEKRVEVMQWLPYISCGAWVLVFLTAGRIVQLDAPRRDTAFLRSRPFSSSDWLASKLSSCLILILPMALLQVAMVLVTGLRPEFIDLLLIFFEEMLAFCVVMTLALAIATRSKTYSNFIGTTMVIFFAAYIIFVMYMIAEKQLARTTKSEWSYDNEYLKLSRLLITQVIAVLGLAGGLFLCMRARRPERLAAVISSTVMIAALAWFFWPLNFVKTFTRPEATAPRSEWPDLSKLKLSFREQESWSQKKAGSVPARFSFSDGVYNDTTYRRISGHTQLDGLPEEWFAFPNSFEYELSLTNGKTFSGRYTASAGLWELMALPLVGMALPWDKSTNPLCDVELAEFPLPKAADAMTGAKLRGNVHVPFKRPVILGRLPLRAAASTKIGNRHISITEVERNDMEIRYKLAIEQLRVLTRGDWYSESHRRIEFLAVNVAKREFLRQGSAESSGRSFGHYSLQFLDFSQTIHRDLTKEHDGGIIPEDWLNGAELLIVGDEFGGTLSQSFDFSEVTLSNP
ncbi:MAG: ABC transporter permease [Verrucomicrobia bacterium]|nr:MAG: ABC transporter permease [Verrucomicrobiota bacterium]